jgi:hypothetical protein
MLPGTINRRNQYLNINQQGLDVEYGPVICTWSSSYCLNIDILINSSCLHLVSHRNATYISYVVIAAACRKVLAGMVRISHGTLGTL